MIIPGKSERIKAKPFFYFLPSLFAELAMILDSGYRNLRRELVVACVAGVACVACVACVASIIKLPLFTYLSS